MDWGEVTAILPSILSVMVAGGLCAAAWLRQTRQRMHNLEIEFESRDSELVQRDRVEKAVVAQILTSLVDGRISKEEAADRLQPHLGDAKAFLVEAGIIAGMKKNDNGMKGSFG